MNKEEYKKSLHRHYPEEPDNVLELAWHFHGMEKAKKYIKLLETCNQILIICLEPNLYGYIRISRRTIGSLPGKTGLS